MKFSFFGGVNLGARRACEMSIESENLDDSGKIYKFNADINQTLKIGKIWQPFKFNGVNLAFFGSKIYADTNRRNACLSTMKPSQNFAQNRARNLIQNRTLKSGLAPNGVLNLLPALLLAFILLGCAAKFERIDAPADGISVAKKDGKFGFIDEKEQIIVPLIYDEVRGFENGLAAVKKDDKWGMIDKFNHALIPLEYGAISKFSQDLLAASEGGKWGFIDRENSIIIDFIYEEAGDFHEGRAKAKMGGKWGFIDTDGRVTVPFIYEEIWEDFRHGLAGFKQDGKYGVINKFGDEIVPAEYDETWEFDLTGPDGRPTQERSAQEIAAQENTGQAKE